MRAARASKPVHRPPEVPPERRRCSRITVNPSSRPRTVKPPLLSKVAFADPISPWNPPWNSPPPPPPPVQPIWRTRARAKSRREFPAPARRFGSPRIYRSPGIKHESNRQIVGKTVLCPLLLPLHSLPSPRSDPDRAVGNTTDSLNPRLGRARIAARFASRCNTISRIKENSITLFKRM